MDIKKNKIIFYLGFVLLILNLSNQISGQEKKFKEILKIKATVVAFDNLSSLFNVGAKTETFFVKINKIKKGEEKSKFIIITRFYSDEEPLIDGFIDGKLDWQFGLARASYCDSKPRNFEYLMKRNDDGTRGKTDITRLTFTENVESQNLPMDELLPCYLLSKNFKQLNN